jgi:putative tricarboxylic transport membrane protein
MDFFSGLGLGFHTCLQPINLVYCFIGVFIGTLVGVLPGIGPGSTIAILFTLTLNIPSSAAIIMLAGIYYGAMYGGSTTSILLNIPGEAASVVTCLDGHQMARKGRAGPALGISAMGSFIGGTFSVIVLMFTAFPLAEAALKFGPPENFALMCLGMTVVVYVAKGSFVKGVVMVILGLILGCVGTDITGKFRFAFGIPELTDGINFATLAMGFFGISEVLTNIEKPLRKRILFKARVKNLLPNLEDWKRSIGPIIRGSFIGFVLGILPGGGHILSSFVSYSTEKRLSKHPEEFGNGAIEGVAGPETANNAATGGAFVPLLALGIPCNGTIALLLGALIIHGLTPGPLLIEHHPEIFWGIIASMYIGNVILVALNLPLIGLWVKILEVPSWILSPLILLFALIGAYGLSNSIFDVIATIVFGIIGYVVRKFKYEEAPLVLAFVLGPLLEAALRQSLIISNGQLRIFFMRPISCVGLVLSIALFFSTVLSGLRRAREKVSQVLDEQ